MDAQRLEVSSSCFRRIVKILICCYCSNIWKLQNFKNILANYTLPDPVTRPSKQLEKPTPPKRAIATNGAGNAVTAKKPKSVNGTDPMDKYECPETESFQLFPKLCTKHGECITEMGPDHRCCKQYGSRRCVKAVARYVAEPKHSRWCFLIHYSTVFFTVISF